jgi:predicted metal-dependent hydrolase
MDKNLPLQKGSFVDYRMRVSGRARNVRLTLSPRDGLVVVVPHRFDMSRIPGIIDEKRVWIEGHLRRLAALSRIGETVPAMALPDAMELSAKVSAEALRVAAASMEMAVKEGRTDLLASMTSRLEREFERARRMMEGQDELSR